MFKIFNYRVDKRAIIRWKVYLDRAKMYIGYINLFMMVVIFVNSVKDNKYGKFLADYYVIAIPVLIILFIGCSLLLGFFDSKLGIRKEELRNLSMNNPVQKEILDTLKFIKKKLSDSEVDLK